MEQKNPLLCIIDDDVSHCKALAAYLAAQNFRVETFPSAVDFLNHTSAPENYDLIISDINMPQVSGYDLCRTLRSIPSAVRLPIILITGSEPSVDQARGLEAGADEFIGKPCASRHLVAKIRSLLEIRARETKKAEELESSQDMNAELARFLSPNLVHRMQADRHNFLKPHRAEVTVLFVDLRGFTAFSEKAEPEEVLEVLQKYYLAVGQAAIKYKGTLGHLAGDGIMIFFNDPEPIKDHLEVALQMALEARNALLAEREIWKKRRYNIDFGMGLCEGYATIGGIGFDRFSQYSVIGTVANFASRLCHAASDGQVLIAHRCLSRLNPGSYQVNSLGELALKGIETPVEVFDVLAFQKRAS